MVYDPFDGTVPQLRSLARGLTASEVDGINCDEAEKVGEAIQRSMDGKSASEATMAESWCITNAHRILHIYVSRYIN